MERRQDTREDIKKRLGIDKLPEPRYNAPDPQHLKGSVKLWKALQCVDVLETAKFSNYISPIIVIDQTMDSWSISTENTFANSIPTDCEIPTHIKVQRVTGIGPIPDANNHYLWLADVLRVNWLELGAKSISPPLIWRTNGYHRTIPCLGFIIKADFHAGNRLDYGANWALLMDKPTPTVVTD